MTKSKLASLAAILVVALAASASAAAKGRDRVVVRGSCSAGSAFTLKLNSPSNGRIEAELKVDQNVNAVVWRIRLSDNGGDFFVGSARTAAPSGSFEARAFARNRRGRDTIRARATSPKGEVCAASASV